MRPDRCSAYMYNSSCLGPHHILANQAVLLGERFKYPVKDPVSCDLPSFANQAYAKEPHLAQIKQHILKSIDKQVEN